MVVYPGLRYERTEGGYHVFQLPVQHPGHDALQGCSGAPILDMERRVVGLVCSGSIDRKSVGEGKSVRVRVSRGGRRRIKKKISEERRLGKECIIRSNTMVTQQHK